ncbi:MAG: ribosome maturation factor RimM [Anaerolineaceae bacterium]|nr:ribosome maturation factor RimM [Anaerolineaceae bacterium]
MSKANQNHTGSLEQSEPAFLIVGHLQKAHGIRGEIAMLVITDFPERLERGKVVWVGEDHKPLTITNIRWKQNLMLLSFSGIEIRELVSQLTNQHVYVKSDDLPKLPSGQYYHHQLIGMKVFEGSNYLGELNEIIVTGANDVFVVSLLDGKELLLPDIKDVVLGIDLLEKRIQVSIPEGLN